jgi:diguanylate cyclase (GGDEF)-like protein
VSAEPGDLRSAARVVAPFCGAACLAWLTVLVGTRVNWTQYGIASVLAVVAGTLAARAMVDSRASHFGPVPGALLFLAAVGLLRNSVGGLNSGISALAMISVFHVALYGRSRRDLAIVVAGVGAFYLAPILIVGPPSYPTTQYRAALLSVTVSAIVGFATLQLVASVRRQASEARDRERMLERLGEVVRGLFDSPRPRIDVCEAVKSISGATVALLYEPAPGTDALRCTAMTAIHASQAEIEARRSSAVHEAFRSGRPELITEQVHARVGNVALWIASGRPQAVLFQPLLRNGVPLGVLVVGWSHSIPAGGSRTTVASLLAHEAAAVIARADVLDHLADEAHTDPLTGLPNRRAWDDQLERALAEDGRLAIAMIDFDHFKRYNDTNGHPAGDRLLRETAAAWRDQLRAGDLLVRLGGEEFGLLLRNCDAATATEVTDRLRRHVSYDQTCSAGIAIVQPGESAEAVVARADQALYDAKSGGRDRALLSQA